MYSRILECHVKPEKKEELRNKMREVLPVLQKQAGLVDVLGLVSDTDPDVIVSITLWKSKEDAERYHRESYAPIIAGLRPMLKRDPVVSLFNVETSTSHRFDASKAA